MSKVQEIINEQEDVKEQKEVLEQENMSEDIQNNVIEKNVEEIVQENVQKQEEEEMNDESKQMVEKQEEKIEVQNLSNNINDDTTCIEKIEPTQNIETREESYEQLKCKKDFLKKYTIAITVVSILLFIGLAVFSTTFGLMNRKSNKIVNGISINGIEVAGLTYEEAKEKVVSIYQNKIKQQISIIHNEYITSFSPEEIETKCGITEALDMAYNVGRSGKVLKDNYAIINAAIGKIDINPSFSYNEETLTKIINETAENLPDKVSESSYRIENDKLIITKGTKGYKVKTEELKAQILDNIIKLKLETEKIDIPVLLQEPQDIDIEKIHSDIYKEAKDAYYTNNPFTIYPHVVGVDFNISKEEAQKLVNSNETTITIPLKLTNPNVTTNQIGTEAFPDLLATYTTSFSTSNTNRTTNIKLASNKINGVVLLPGEEFSYNKVVGQRTASAGFKAAAAYVSGKVVNEIGGGICQVSSTLYNTALRANLEIVKRSNHRFATGYVPLSTDATVSWGGPEFIFKNSRKYPIKIVSTVIGGKIKVDIYGCKEETEYEVIIQSETLQTIPMKTEYRTNTSLPKGTTKKVQKGHSGYKSRAYRILKLNGTVVSKQLLSTDTYARLSTIIEKN